MVNLFRKEARKLPGREYPPAEETGIVEEMIREMKSQLLRLYKDGETLRQAHPKMHGCVHADFIIEPGLPEDLKIGIFKSAATFSCLIRFSNAHSTPQPDAKKDVRGMAIKLQNVQGQKLLSEPEAAFSQDFLLISHPIFVARHLAQFRKTIKAITSDKLIAYFLNPLHWGVVLRTLKSYKKCRHVLEIPYWSTTPSQFGDIDRAVKYHVKPAGGEPFVKVDTSSPDYLRVNLSDTLSKRDASFDFYIQFQTSADAMPVEDPTVEWKSPFIKVAQINIPQQSFDTPSQNLRGENLSFTPWHSLAAHRPLGGINRGRKHAYEAMAAYRLHRNKVLPHGMVKSSGSLKNNDMTNPANEQIVKELFEGYKSGHIDFNHLFDPDVVWLEPGAPDIPFAGTFNGLAEMQQMMHLEATSLTVTSFVPKNFFSNDDTVIVVGADSAKVNTTQKSYSTDWTMEFTLANKKIIRVQTFMDTHAIAKAFA